MLQEKHVKTNRAYKEIEEKYGRSSFVKPLMATLFY
jgi:hypothetical protein